MMRTTAGLVLAAVGACAAPQAGHVRFHNVPPVTEVNDRRDVPNKPDEVPMHRNLTRFDVNFHKRLTRWMEMRKVRRATSVNSIDEVPNSTWFENRIGVRELAVEELATGPNLTGTPEQHLPFIVKSSKVGGKALGLTVEDQRGKKYILKFDNLGFPELETSADLVGQRLLWAAGYHVPEDYVVVLRKQDLVLSKDSVVKDPRGRKQQMTQEFLDELLRRVHTSKDGTIRGLASLYLDGIPVGGHPRDGVRDDDPNDRIPQQLRRERRGAYVFFSWLDLTDMKEDNTLDVYVKDPADPKVHYVMHYLIDFGKSLGSQAYTSRNPALGRSYSIDPGDMGRSFFSLGLWRRPWEAKTWPDIVGVGVFDSKTYDPGSWKANTPNYFPFLDVDRYDAFWAAKILARFTPAHIRAAVDQGRYSDPRAVEYITRTLIERQRKTVAHWFGQVAPLDGFAVEASGQLCFQDLELHHQVGEATPENTAYRVRAFKAKGTALAWNAASPASNSGRACTTRLPAVDGDGYTIIEVSRESAGRRLPPVLVHVAMDPATRAPRVIGLRRQ